MLDVAGVEKKLRQADFFLGWLQQASTEFLRQPPREGDGEPLEF
jgi:hypothetical protein